MQYHGHFHLTQKGTPPQTQKRAEKPIQVLFLKKSEMLPGLLSFLLIFSDICISVLPTISAREQDCTEQCVHTPIKAQQSLDINPILLTEYSLLLIASSLYLPNKTNNHTVHYKAKKMTRKMLFKKNMSYSISLKKEETSQGTKEPYSSYMT